jgi:hypothetical protein
MTPRASSLFLVAVAMFVVLGHICAAPFHAHAGAVTTHSEDHPERGSDEAAHGGSCEALRTASNVDLPSLPAARLDIVLLTELLGATTIEAPLPTPDTSRPLFLLHSSLLI